MLLLSPLIPPGCTFKINVSGAQAEILRFLYYAFAAMLFLTSAPKSSRWPFLPFSSSCPFSFPLLSSLFSSSFLFQLLLLLKIKGDDYYHTQQVRKEGSSRGRLIQPLGQEAPSRFPSCSGRQLRFQASCSFGHTTL